MSILTRKVLCPECDISMNLILAKKKYPTYVCPTETCDMQVSAQKNGKPNGIPANTLTRKARMHAHVYFDAWWAKNNISRKKAYKRLQKIMNMSEEDAHIGRFNADQCWFLVAEIKKRSEGT